MYKPVKSQSYEKLKTKPKTGVVQAKRVTHYHADTCLFPPMVCGTELQGRSAIRKPFVAYFSKDDIYQNVIY